MVRVPTPTTAEPPDCALAQIQSDQSSCSCRRRVGPSPSSSPGKEDHHVWRTLDATSRARRASRCKTARCRDVAAVARIKGGGVGATGLVVNVVAGCGTQPKAGRPKLSARPLPSSSSSFTTSATGKLRPRLELQLQHDDDQDVPNGQNKPLSTVPQSPDDQFSTESASGSPSRPPSRTLSTRKLMRSGSKLAPQTLSPFDNFRCLVNGNGIGPKDSLPPRTLRKSLSRLPQQHSANWASPEGRVISPKPLQQQQINIGAGEERLLPTSSLATSIPESDSDGEAFRTGSAEDVDRVDWAYGSEEDPSTALAPSEQSKENNLGYANSDTSSDAPAEAVEPLASPVQQLLPFGTCSVHGTVIGPAGRAIPGPVAPCMVSLTHIFGTRSDRRVPIERMPAEVLDRTVRLLGRRAWMAALARASRRLFCLVIPILWEDPWDVQTASGSASAGCASNVFGGGVDTDLRGDEHLTMMLATPPEFLTIDYARFIRCLPVSHFASPWVRRLASDAGLSASALAAPIGLNTTLELALERHYDFVRFLFPGVGEDDPIDALGTVNRVRGLTINATLEKYKRRFSLPFQSRVLCNAHGLTRLHVDGAEAFFEGWAREISPDGPHWLSTLRSVELAFHVNSLGAAPCLATFLKSLPRLHRLSLTVLNVVTAGRLEALADIGQKLPDTLSHFHFVPPEDSMSTDDCLARFVARLFASFSGALLCIHGQPLDSDVCSCDIPKTTTHLELYPTSEYSRARYFLSFPKTLERERVPVHRLSLWLPEIPDLSHPPLLWLIKACGTLLQQLDLQPWWHHPRIGRSKRAPTGAIGALPTLVSLSPTPNELAQLVSAGQTGGSTAAIASALAAIQPYPAMHSQLVDLLCGWARGLRVLALPPLRITVDLVHVGGLAQLPRLQHVSWGLATPKPSRGGAGGGSGSGAGHSALRAANALICEARGNGSYTRMARIAHSIVERAPALRSVHWTSLPAQQNEPYVFDTYAPTFFPAAVPTVGGKSSRSDVITAAGAPVAAPVLMHYEEIASGWAFCGLGVHSIGHIREQAREIRRTEMDDDEVSL